MRKTHKSPYRYGQMRPAPADMGGRLLMGWAFLCLMFAVLVAAGVMQ